VDAEDHTARAEGGGENDDSYFLFHSPHLSPQFYYVLPASKHEKIVVPILYCKNNLIANRIILNIILITCFFPSLLFFCTGLHFG